MKPGDAHTVTIVSPPGRMNMANVYVGNFNITDRCASVEVSISADCLPEVNIEIRPEMVFSYEEPLNSGAIVSEKCELVHKLALQKKRGLARVNYLHNRGLNARGLVKFDHFNKRVKLMF